MYAIISVIISFFCFRAFHKVYTFSPVFRAEKTSGRNHLSEFQMVEAEMSFIYSAEDLMNVCVVAIPWQFFFSHKNYFLHIKAPIYCGRGPIQLPGHQLIFRGGEFKLAF